MNKRMKLTYLMLFIIIMLIIDGCVSYNPPSPDLYSKHYKEISNLWLKSNKKVLTLKDAVKIALANNPDYTTAKLNMIAAYAVYYSAISAFSPTATISYSATQVQNPKGSKGDTTSGALTASYQAFSGLRTLMNMLAMRSLALQSEMSFIDYKRLLIKSVVNSYNQILMDIALLNIAKANEEFMKDMLRITKMQYEAGSKPVSDVLNFEIQLNNARADVISSRESYIKDRYLFAALLGFPNVDLPKDIKFPKIAEENILMEHDVRYYLDLAISRRPDLQAKGEAIRVARYNLYSSWGSFSPTLDLSLNYGFTTSPGNNYWFGHNTDFSYGLSGDWNLWQGGSRIFNVRNQEAMLDIAKQNLLSKWINVVKEVRSSYIALKSSITKAELYKKNVNLAKKRRDLLKEEYNAGNVSVTILNQGQLAYVVARQQYVTALIGVSNSKAALWAAAAISY